MVLLVDDDLVSREVTATVLTMSGYTVHTADNGEAALEWLAAGAIVPDLILMDAQMPGLSGTALVAELRRRSRARIIAVSGSNPPQEVAAAADGFLLKPLDVEALRKLLEGQTRKQTAPAELGPEAPVISYPILAQLRLLMPEKAVRQIYEAIVSDLVCRTSKLETAIARGDEAEMRRIGHAIKGGCAMAGALQAARLGALIENISLEGAGYQSDNGTMLLRDLRSAARALQGMLDAELPA
ncbi:MAG TPA: response regulator [Terracidiphilus sp.]|nr:response regulator [Terracidiphilus sp.]